MKRHIQWAISHPLISGGITVFIGSTLGSFLNFLYNLFMTRNLSLAEYGTLASLVSLITLFSLPVGAVLPTLIYFSAKYFAENDMDKVRGLFVKVTKFYAFLGIVVFLGFLFLRDDVSRFFKISDFNLIASAGFMIGVAFVGIANPALLQGKLDFKFISASNLLNAVLKLAIGVGLVFLGYSVGGALVGFFLGSFIPYIVSFVPLKFLFHKKTRNPHISLSQLFSYGAPAAIASFSVTSLITSDILLVKHFFNPESAGIYAGISLIGRVIFFFTAPIATVMFPLIVQKHTRNEKYNTDLFLSFGLVLLPSIFLTISYFLFPEFILQISTKAEYVKGAGLLGIFGVFTTLFALLSIMTNFYLSVKKTIVSIPLAIGAGIQIVAIWFFHNSFEQVVTISIIITSLLLITLLLYYWKQYEKKAPKTT